jgi:hypothetical protein
MVECLLVLIGAIDSTLQVKECSSERTHQAAALFPEPFGPCSA